jgi:hypothetical protein
VKREVASALSLRFAKPQVKGFDRLVRPRRANHFDVSRGPADQRGLAGRLMRVLCKRPHERQIDVDVGIDETGEDVFTRGINHFGSGRRLNVPLNARDGFVLAKDIRDVPLAGSDDFSVFD